MLNHLKLLVWDLDYLVFDCSELKVTALRQSLIALADSIPHSVRLPDAIDAEGGLSRLWIPLAPVSGNRTG